LWDIQQAAGAISRFVAGADFESYSRDEMMQAAVERKFEIIGEALGRLAKEDPDLAQRIPEFRNIIAFRNLLIHGYAAVDPTRVWQIVGNSLPPLRARIAELLDDLRDPEP
jgi:uncharacterized protein with HEPN domain